MTDQSWRLAKGGLVDRSRRLPFVFDGKSMDGHPGDTLASALLANGVRMVGRSFKYPRPRGLRTYSILLKVLGKMKSFVISRKAGSQSCCQSENLSSRGKIPKFMEPMLSEAISGLARIAAARRSSMVMPRPPPVDTLITASLDCLMIGRNCMKVSGLGSGLPVSGSRACRWMIDAPASAAAIDS